MRRAIAIFALGLVVGWALSPAAAQDRRLPGMQGVNHLAFATGNYDEMLRCRHTRRHGNHEPA